MRIHWERYSARISPCARSEIIPSKLSERSLSALVGGQNRGSRLTRIVLQSPLGLPQIVRQLSVAPFAEDFPPRLHARSDFGPDQVLVREGEGVGLGALVVVEAVDLYISLSQPEGAGGMTYIPVPPKPHRLGGHGRWSSEADLGHDGRVLQMEGSVEFFTAVLTMNSARSERRRLTVRWLKP